MNLERKLLILKIRMWFAIAFTVLAFAWIIVDGLKKDARIGGDQQPASPQNPAAD